MKSLAEIRAHWLANLHSTDPADRPLAEAGVRALYAAANFAEPRSFFWFESPCAASWAVAALIPVEDRTSSQLLAPNILSREEKERMERARAGMREQLGVADWSAVVAAIGESRIASLQPRMNPSRMFASAFLEARYAMVDDVSSLFTAHGDDDDLARAESHFWSANRGVLNSALHCPTTDFLIRRSFVDEQTFSSIADDEYRAEGREAPPILRAAAEIGRSSGMWWPYENAAILCDRPVEIRLNDRHVPHREDGPAVVFRDGWQVYAWNGKAVPERWIMQPERVPPGEYKGFDPTFGKWAKSKGQPTGAAKKRTKPGAILKAALSADPAARLEQLRVHAGGRLPLYDRYQAGEHREVWKELVALGAGVRADPHAADALAVAYETMRRVEANVRTVVERLTAMQYVFSAAGAPASSPASSPGSSDERTRLHRDQPTGQVRQSGQLGGVLQLFTLFGSLLKARDVVADQARMAKSPPRSESARPHVPPGPDARKEIADFERELDVLPLSLRVFYEVVGEVNLMGHHPTLDPEGNPVATDPLVVYGLDEGIVEYDEEGEEERPAAVIIAPDDLHKANVSGGDPYLMTIPDLRADGELVNERHGLFFVDYLRLCFEFGGFPGYEGKDVVPAQLQSLKAGLLTF
jgi:hypothetical protein